MSSVYKAFSGKKKKEQLKARREKKRNNPTEESQKGGTPNETNVNRGEVMPVMVRGRDGRFDPKRLRTVFDLDTRDDIEKRKKEANLPLAVELRLTPWRIHENTLNAEPLPIPVRPNLYNVPIGKDQLEALEKTAFESWREQLKEVDSARLNYFEQNEEVWRQLWRVSERSDVVVLVTDARFPLFHFPPALYSYVTSHLKKHLLLVFNKADLVPPGILAMWRSWFQENYPDLRCIEFSAFPSSDDTLFLESRRRKFLKGRRRYEAATGVKKLIDAVRALNITRNGKPVVIPEIEEHAPPQEEDEDVEDSEEDDDQEENDEESEEGDSEDDEQDEEKGKDKKSQSPVSEKSASPLVPAEESLPIDHDYVTLGMVGHPNVGKSSLINGLLGKKMVSTSRTPGHTKHFQTLFLKGSRNVLLCDCPGLVFPALDRPRALQILLGLFPIAQVREPFTAVRYLAERVPLEEIYKLHLPEDDDYWTPFGICEALALRNGYKYARSGRPDVHRAARDILVDCLDGRIVISWPPPGEKFQQAYLEWQKRSQEEQVAELQQRKTSSAHDSSDEEGAPVHAKPTRRDRKLTDRRNRLERAQDDTDKVPHDLVELSMRVRNQSLAEAKPSAPKSAAPPQQTKAKSKSSRKAQEYAERLAERQQRSNLD